MKKHMHAPRRCAVALAIGLAFLTPAAHSAGLGRITVQSALGQPLRAEVEVTAVSREEAASLGVRLASAAAFRQANLDFNAALTRLRMALERRSDGNFVVRISSPTAVNEPYLDLLIELTSATGRVLREYTILLDPPALRATQEVVAPAAGRAAPAPAAAAPAPAPAPAAAARPAPARTAAAAAPAQSTYEVKRGDTLSGIAERTRPAAASLDQMLVALFRANPDAFIAENMNNLRAGSVLKIPEAQQAVAVDPATARREIATQSADFARYRSRLAQAATSAGPAAAGAVGQGRITTRVEDRGSAPAGDQLKIAQGGTAAKAGDEAVARDRQLKDLLDRVAELERVNQQLQAALELQSKAGAQAQTAAESKAGAAPAPAAAPGPAPMAAAPAPAPAPAAPASTAPAPAPAPVASAPPAPVEPEKPAPKAAAPAPAPAEEGWLSSLTGSNLPMVAGLGAVIAGLVAFGLYRRRKSAGEREDFDLAGEAARGNSLFGQTGGRSVDTGAASTFNSSFIPAASQLDSTEVDPVAEADVYIAYGREEQAEDILKEALRLQPDRNPARVKLMEILARRGDKAGFAQQAAELKQRTSGTGEDWERAAVIGRSVDPANPMFAAVAAAGVEMASRGPTTELRLGPSTVSRSGVNTGGFTAPPATLGGEESESGFADSSSGFEEQFTEPRPSQMPRQPADSVMPLDSEMGAETVLPLDANTNVMPPTIQGGKPPSAPNAAPDLSELEFESLNTMPATRLLEPEPPSTSGEPPMKFDFDLPSVMPAKVPPMPSLPDLDLNLPPAGPTTVAPKAPAQGEPVSGFDFNVPAGRPSKIDTGRDSGFPTTVGGARKKPAPLEDALSRPTLLGDLSVLPDSPTRLASNTDQATVPLIDFDLTGADLPLNTSPGRGGTPTGSPMASQMATKLDLARGYIDLGVKDGARELLEEVMRDGTREQRQSAVDLMKQIDR
jgi:pilus assembly protein FimV